jgi:hypothetical protein
MALRISPSRTANDRLGSHGRHLPREQAQGGRQHLVFVGEIIEQHPVADAGRCGEAAQARPRQPFVQQVAGDVVERCRPLVVSDAHVFL